MQHILIIGDGQADHRSAAKACDQRHRPDIGRISQQGHGDQVQGVDGGPARDQGGAGNAGSQAGEEQKKRHLPPGDQAHVKGDVAGTAQGGCVEHQGYQHHIKNACGVYGTQQQQARHHEGPGDFGHGLFEVEAGRVVLPSRGTVAGPAKADQQQEPGSGKASRDINGHDIRARAKGVGPEDQHCQKAGRHHGADGEQDFIARSGVGWAGKTGQREQLAENAGSHGDQQAVAQNQRNRAGREQHQRDACGTGGGCCQGYAAAVAALVAQDAEPDGCRDGGDRRQHQNDGKFSLCQANPVNRDEGLVGIDRGIECAKQQHRHADQAQRRVGKHGEFRGQSGRF